MKLVVAVVLALVAVSYAVDPEPSKIISSEFNQNPDGAYVYRFETDDGTSRSENGELKEALDEDNKPHVVLAVRGQYTYTDPLGHVDTINYFADETGYHAEGDSIPKAL